MTNLIIELISLCIDYLTETNPNSSALNHLEMAYKELTGSYIKGDLSPEQNTDNLASKRNYADNTNVKDLQTKYEDMNSSSQNLKSSDDLNSSNNDIAGGESAVVLPHTWKDQKGISEYN